MIRHICPHRYTEEYNAGVFTMYSFISLMFHWAVFFLQVTYDDDDDDDDDIDWEMSSDSSSSESDGGEGPGTTVYTAAMFLKK